MDIINKGVKLLTINSLQLAKSYVSGKASVAAVGDLFQIPYAEDLGLTV